MSTTVSPNRAGSIVQRATAECVGTGFLLATVVGSGIMGERLAAGNAAIALLANALATGAALVALILAFADVSGAHFNPLVTLADAFVGKSRWRDVPAYCVGQCAGAFAGVLAAHAMFELPLVQLSRRERSGYAPMLSELVATAGLVLVIHATSRRRASATPYAVAAYITAAYWFTASTSFANPAVTLARSFTDTFSGIRLADAPGFILAQCAGAAVATMLAAWLVPPQRGEGARS